MKNKEIYIFKTENCEWCDEMSKMLIEVGLAFNSLSIEKNGIALGVARKLCGGIHSCLVVDGKEIRPDRKTIREVILK